MQQAAEWEEHHEAWLAPFLATLGHKARRRMLPLYVSGLIGPGERKSMQPMAARLAAGDYDQLHHFVAAGIWDEAPLEAELLVQADKLAGGEATVVVVGETALPKKGEHSVGVAPQYVQELGRSANCQLLVSLTLVRGDVPLPVALRLFLPESWTGHPDRLERAGVPLARRGFWTKPEIALAEIGRLIAAGARFGCVLADAGYGQHASFRHGLTSRGLAWAVGISRYQDVYAAAVDPVPPTPDRGRLRRRPVAGAPSISAEQALAEAEARGEARKLGAGEDGQARFVAMRVRPADGGVLRAGDKRQQHLPGDETWLIGERRADGETGYYLASLPDDADLRALARVVRARRAGELAHRQLKEELGLGHFEGRSWRGLHRHALMTMIAFAFLQSRRLARAGQRRKEPTPALAAAGSKAVLPVSSRMAGKKDGSPG